MKLQAKTKFVLINVLLAFAFIFIVGFIALQFLDNYTAHGDTIAVPSFAGMDVSQAEKTAAKRDLRVRVVDSIYDPDAEEGVVVEQYPSSGTEVKTNRLINLTLNTNGPEKIPFPDLKNAAFRQTVQTLTSRGFRMGQILYSSSEYRNLVLQLISEGKKLKKGDLLTKGAVIDVVLGDGGEGNTVYVPNLRGKKARNASLLILNSYLNVGSVTQDATIVSDDDLSDAFIYKQSPSPGSKVFAGSKITVFITKDEKRLNEIQEKPTDMTDVTTDDMTDDMTDDAVYKISDICVIDSTGVN